MTYYNKVYKKSPHFTNNSVCICWSIIHVFFKAFLIMAQEVFSLIMYPGNFVLILGNFSKIKGCMNYSCDMAGIIKVIRTYCEYFYHNFQYPLNNITKQSVLNNRWERCKRYISLNPPCLQNA